LAGRKAAEKKEIASKATVKMAGELMFSLMVRHIMGNGKMVFLKVQAP